MDLLIFACVVGGLYGCLLFFDSFFKSCMHYPYQAFLNGTGLTVKPFSIHWHTTALNRLVFKWAHKYPRFYVASFDVGVWVAIVLLPAVFIMHFAWTFFVQTSGGSTKTVAGSTDSTKSSSANLGLELMLPGVNLPIDEIGYYVAALAVCSIVHELGHAIAAVLVDVPVTAFGVHLLFVFPMAYTELNTERLHATRLWPKLRVLCAGVWHNVVLAAAAWTLLMALALLVRPWFAVGDGVVVTQVHRASPLRGARGLAAGDVVTDVNGCRVADVDAWYACLVRSLRQPPAWCVSSEYVREHDESVPVAFAGERGADGEHSVECCDPASTKNVCFEYWPGDEMADNVLAEIPQHMCLQAREAIEQSEGLCDAQQQQQQQQQQKQQQQQQCVGSFCVRPLLGNGTTIMQMRRKDGRADVMYVGHPADVSRTVRVSGFVPKTRWLSAAWADGVARMLRYVVVFSLGLACVNVLPCYAFDGQHIVTALVQHGLVGWLPERGKRELVALGVTGVGSLLFAAGLMKMAYGTWTRWWH